jgi:hypothetical protein
MAIWIDSFFQTEMDSCDLVKPWLNRAPPEPVCDSHLGS